MEKKHLKAGALLLAAAAVVSGCNGLGKMAKYASTITYTVDPSPLIVKGDTVHVNINGNFPAKYFSKKALAELTPTIEGIGDQMLLATEPLREIHRLLDGKEWSPDTLDEIARILTDAGFVIKEPE